MMINCGRMVNGSVAVTVCAGVPESVNWKVREVAVAAAVGVPLITPVVAPNVNPAGSVPEVNCQLYDGVPPCAPSEKEYDVPTAPFGSADVVICRPGGSIVKLRVVVPVCTGGPGSVTLKLREVAVTAAVGVPLIRPDAFSVSPAGSVPEVNCQLWEPAPPVAARV